MDKNRIRETETHTHTEIFLVIIIIIVLHFNLVSIHFFSNYENVFNAKVKLVEVLLNYYLVNNDITIELQICLCYEIFELNTSLNYGYE